MPTRFARHPVAGIALIGSLAVHASVLAGMPRAPETAQPQAASLTEIDVSVASAEPTPRSDSSEVMTTARSTAAPVARSRSREAVARSSVSVAEPATLGVAQPVPRSSLESDAPSMPLPFVMRVGPATGPGPATAPAGGASERRGEAVFGEDGIDARPRLLAWQAPRYPPSAASAGVEVDVPVDVVIDTEGVVTDVRLPKHFGYGLDEAAVAAARSYRFTHGLKAGRAVRVRMRCTVMFRLN